MNINSRPIQFQVGRSFFFRNPETMRNEYTGKLQGDNGYDFVEVSDPRLNAANIRVLRKMTK